MDFVENLLEPALGKLLAIDVISIDDAGQLFAPPAIREKRTTFEWF
jgi:hypothetical protein